MRCFLLAGVLGLASVAGLGVLGRTEAAEPAAGEWKLAWSDEFDGKEIDRTKWDFDIGNGFYSYDAKTWIGGWLYIEVGKRLRVTSRISQRLPRWSGNCSRSSVPPVKA